MSFDLNVFVSFLSLVLDMYPLEDEPSNLNHVQGQSFKTVIDYLKAISIAPHSSNELRSLDYNKIKVEYVFFRPIIFNDDIIFELSSIHLLIGHFGQMQGMDYKYDGHAWCKVKTSNIKNNSSLRFKNTKCLGHLHCDNDSCKHFLHFAVRNEVCWTDDSAQIPLASQFAPGPHVCTIVCRFCVVISV
jgi:hypothetical protein